MQSRVRGPGSGVRTFFLVLTVLVSVSCGGCAARRLPPPAPSPVSLPSAQQLLAPLHARRQSVTSLRGLARVAYKDSQDKGTAKQAVAVAAPDHFRLELFSPVGVAALVTSDGRTLAAYFPGEKTLYRGAATPLNVARFTRVMLSAREIAGLLLGLPVLPSDGEAGTVRLDAEYDWYRLDCLLPGGSSQVMWFEQKTLRLMRAELLAGNGTAVTRVSLADYREVNGQAFPFEIILSDLQGKQEAAVYYERVELNPHPPDALFALAPIAGVREINADALAVE